IDLDHQEYLGDTVTAIAAEKSYIIRSGTAIAAAQVPEVTAILDTRAAAVGVPLQREGRELSVGLRARSQEGQRLDLAGPGWRNDDVAIHLLGAYQPTNTLLAVAAAHVLGAGATAIRQGLARARWPGRFEVHRRAAGGWLVLDGAHNPAGARALAASL